MSYNLSAEEFLAHHGILGQKWGIRRFQNKDGSLTPRGEKRAKRLREQYEKVTGVEFGHGPKKATSRELQDMSDEELDKYVTRKSVERTALQINRDIDNLSEEKKQKTDGFVKRAMKTSVEPAVLNAGKDVLQKYLTKKGGEWLGLDNRTTKELAEEAEASLRLFEANEKLSNKKAGKDSRSEYDRLKEESELSNFRANIARNEKAAKEAREGKNLSRSEQLAQKAKDVRNKEIIENYLNKQNKSKVDSYVNNISSQPTRLYTDREIEKEYKFKITGKRKK